MPKSRVGRGLTQARGPVHGNFEEGAKITQGVMGLFSVGSQYHTLTAGQREAIHMIVHKLHRIVTGNSQHKDHWDDIGGYAQLGADACEEAVTKGGKRAKVRPISLKKARPARKAKAAKKAPVAQRVPRAKKKAPRGNRHPAPARQPRQVQARAQRRPAATRPAPVAQQEAA